MNIKMSRVWKRFVSFDCYKVNKCKFNAESFNEILANK